MKHIYGNNFCKTDFWNGQKQRRKQYSKLVAAVKIQLKIHLKAEDFLEVHRTIRRA